MELRIALKSGEFLYITHSDMGMVGGRFISRFNLSDGRTLDVASDSDAYKDRYDEACMAFDGMAGLDLTSAEFKDGDGWRNE